MTKTLTITQAAKVHGVSDKTIRRWIESGKLSAEKIDRKWIVHVNLDIDRDNDPDNVQDHVQSLKAQLERANADIHHFREHIAAKDLHIEQCQSSNVLLTDQLTEKDKQIDHLTQVVAMSQKNIGALTEQLDDSRQMIEDMRSRSWWKRIFCR
ncbi:MAG: helix-turn-helix domain-containing protein [Candidatus Poribacteria bacterium]|nr:helix-turn-helix domain-containing protein [Candidatus Poribacteria bacterium]